MQRLEFLRNVPLFADLPEQDLARLAAVAEEVRVPAGKVLFRQGSPGDFAYVIEEGQVEIRRFSDGREVPLATRGAGEVIGEMALLEESTRMAAALAVSDSLLVAIGREQLQQLLGSSPSAARAMLRTVMTRLRETEAALRHSEKMAQLGTLTAGLAHELGNPASAALRGAEQMRSALRGLVEGAAGLARLGLTPPQLQELERRLAPARRGGDEAREAGALDRSDREDTIERWLSSREFGKADALAGDLAEAGYSVEALEELAGRFTSAQLRTLLPLLGSSSLAETLLIEIGAGAREIDRIVKALKSYVYLDQGPVQEVDIHEGLENTLIILRHKLKAGIEVKKEYAPALPPVMAHGSELNQVWTNIIDNAADALSGRGEIVLRTRGDGPWVLVEVQDDGPGIPPEVRSRLFTPFFTTKPMGKGSGQGLMIAWNVVRHHGGTIEVDSQPGRTVFTVRLPVRTGPAETGERAPGSRGADEREAVHHAP